MHFILLSLSLSPLLGFVHHLYSCSLFFFACLVSVPPACRRLSGSVRCCGVWRDEKKKKDIGGMQGSDNKLNVPHKGLYNYDYCSCGRRDMYFWLLKAWAESVDVCDVSLTL